MDRLRRRLQHSSAVESRESPAAPKGGSRACRRPPRRQSRRDHCGRGPTDCGGGIFCAEEEEVADLFLQLRHTGDPKDHQQVVAPTTQTMANCFRAKQTEPTRPQYYSGLRETRRHRKKKNKIYQNEGNYKLAHLRSRILTGGHWLAIQHPSIV